MSPSKIMLIRHGEKPEDGGPEKGIDKNGNEDFHDLIVKGWQRSGALGRFFKPLDGHLIHPLLSVPTILYAPGPNAADRSTRALHTLSVVSSLTGYAIISGFGVGEEKELADDIMTKDGVVLVAWEHNNIKIIIEHITGGTVPTPHWKKHRFDMVDILHKTPGWQLDQVPQMLLQDDSADLFKFEQDN
jgi:hypothetical protein